MGRIKTSLESQSVLVCILPLQFGHTSLPVFSRFFFFWAAFLLETITQVCDVSYYAYVPDSLQWNRAGEMCKQRTGALATVSNAEENQELTKFLKSLNISQSVWIAKKVITRITSRFSRFFKTFHWH